MPLPSPIWLTLPEAARLVAERCGVGLADAQARLGQAGRDHELIFVGDQGKSGQLEGRAAPDWLLGSITLRTRHNVYTYQNVRLFARGLDAWLASVNDIPAPARPRVLWPVTGPRELPEPLWLTLPRGLPAAWPRGAEVSLDEAQQRWSAPAVTSNSLFSWGMGKQFRALAVLQLSIGNRARSQSPTPLLRLGDPSADIRPIRR